MENEEKVKKSRIGLIVIACSIIVIVVGVVLLLNNNNKSSSGKGNDEPPVVTNTAANFNGVYKDNGVTIKLFALGEKNVSYNIEANGGSVSSTGEFKNGTVFGSLFDENYTFRLTDNGVLVDTNSAVISPGTYSKSGDYKIEEFYEDNVGEAKYLSSKFNGKYTGESTNVLIYNTRENDVIFIINKTVDNEFSSFQRNFEIKDENTLVHEDDYDGSVSTITFNDDTIVVDIKADTLIDYNGTYTKESGLTIEDLLKEIYNYE